MALPFPRRPLNRREQAVAHRLPPGQYLTGKWPVLHYGGFWEGFGYHNHGDQGQEERYG